MPKRKKSRKRPKSKKKQAKRKHGKSKKSEGKKVNPRTGRKTVYLGHRVPDTGKPGLDSAKEDKAIARAILKDYESGRIDKRTATSRLNLLELIIKKDKDMKGKKEAREYIDRVIRPKLSGD